MILIGTALNALGILAGGIAGLLRRRPLAPEAQGNLRTALGILLVFAGLHLLWTHVGGGFLATLRQCFIVMISMSLGRLLGMALRLQAGSNRLGKYAASRLEQAGPGRGRAGFGEGFLTCAILFSIAPLAVLGAVQSGVEGDVRAFALKAVVDALAAMAFVGPFRGAVFAAILPMVAWQGTLTLAVRAAEPWLHQHGLVDSIQATGGMLLFCVALLILEIRKVQVADYLPSLAVAPLITWFWH
jgi:uncharacterized membrane protein YqgA involved in biofilm formation